MRFRSIFILTGFVGFAISGFTQNSIPRDTSFTVYSAGIKIKKDFPQSEAVKQIPATDFMALPEQVYRVRENRTLHADIYLPIRNGGAKTPCVLLIHGGGWRSGDKTQMAPLAQKLASAGYATATIEHRLSVEALYPAAIYDLKEAVRFFRANAQLYNIDPDRIISLGFSAGATLASFLGTTGDLPQFEDPHPIYPNVSSKVFAVINIDGVIDFTDAAESGKDEDPKKPSAGTLWFGGTYKQIPEKWKEASPIHYISKKTPPFLYVNSSIPRFHAGRDHLLEILQKNKTYCEVHTIENTPHPFILFHPWFNEASGYIVNFLNKLTNK